MTLFDYMDMRLLYKRWKVLDQQWSDRESQTEYPEPDFTLKDVSDINAVIGTLSVVRRMYDGK